MRFIKQMVALGVSVALTATTVAASPAITSGPDKIKAYVGDKVKITYGFSYEFPSQKIVVNMTNFFGTSVFFTGEELTESQLMAGKYSYTIDTSSLSAGTYNINAHMEWYTFYAWHRDFGEKNTTLTLVDKPDYAVKITKAKNVKSRKIKVAWKKVKGATKYQVKIGKRRYSTTKCSYLKKKLKKGKTYTVNVRAYVDGRWKSWTINKKVKITK